jgi:hypothetical protein
LSGATDVAALAREAWLAERPLTEIAQRLAEHGRPQRLAAAQALQAYEQAVAALRAAVVYGLVHDEGLGLAQLASTMGVSRQAVTRLYRAGAEAVQETS